MSQRTLLIAVAALAAILAVFLSDEFNRAGLTGSGGYITDGEKFGLQIGSVVDEADRRLAGRRFVVRQPAQEGRCLSRAYSDGETAKLWEHRGWPRATICVIERDGLVTAIGWSVGGWQF